jgi:hypothetical protein
MTSHRVERSPAEQHEFSGQYNLGVADERARLLEWAHFAVRDGPERLPFVPFPAIQ